MLGHGCIGEFAIGEFDIPSAGVAGWTGKVTRISREQADREFKKVDWYERFLAAKGHAIERRRILLQEPIKQLGEHKIAVRLHRDVVAEITVNVVRED